MDGNCRLLKMACELLAMAPRLSLSDVAGGAEGFARFAMPCLSRWMPFGAEERRRVPGLVFKALRKRSVELDPSLEGRYDELFLGEDECAELMRCAEMLAVLGRAADRMTVSHVTRGAEGFAEFAFPYLAGSLLLEPRGRLHRGDRIGRLVFGALRERSVWLAEGQLRRLYERRASEPASAEVDAEIVMLCSMVDEYDEFFGIEANRLLQRCLSRLLRARLEGYAAEEEPASKRRRTE